MLRKSIFQSILLALLLISISPVWAIPATISICFTPGGNCADQIIDQINQENKAILVEAYQLTSADIAKALVKAKQRRVDVKIILDKTQYTTKRYSAALFFEHMQIPVWIDYKPAIAHNKIIILMSNNTVLTGSYNFSKAAQLRNAENLVIIKSPEITQTYRDNFQRRLTASLTLNQYKVLKQEKAKR